MEGFYSLFTTKMYIGESVDPFPITHMLGDYQDLLPFFLQTVPYTMKLNFI